MSTGLTDVSLRNSSSPKAVSAPDLAADGSAEELALEGWADVDAKESAPASLEGASAPRGSETVANNTPVEGSQVPAAPSGWFGCLSAAYYRPYFNVDTVDVLERLRCVILPVQTVTRPSRPPASAGMQQVPSSESAADAAERGVPDSERGYADGNPFLDGDGARALADAGGDEPTVPVPFVFSDRPDLYGPLWLSLTLAFAVGAASNLSGWFTFEPQSEDSLWHYDFARVTTALSCSLGFVAIIPIAGWAVLQYIGRPLPLVLLVCVQGYSLTMHLLAALLCTMPFAAVQWLAVTVAGCAAGYFEWRVLGPLLGVSQGAPGSDGRTPGSAAGADVDDSSLSAEARQAKQALRYGLMGSVVLMQLGMALMLKLFFLAAW